MYTAILSVIYLVGGWAHLWETHQPDVFLAWLVVILSSDHIKVKLSK